MMTIVIIGILLYVIFSTSKKKKHDIEDFSYVEPIKERKMDKELRQELLKSISENIKISVTSSLDTGLDINSSDLNGITEEFDESANQALKSFKFTNNDDSIIDVTNQSFVINSNEGLNKYPKGVPLWPHQYVYSYSELLDTTVAQKYFYLIFKENFQSEIYFDLEGNTNYAFILLFDLLNEFDADGNLDKLEKQIRALGQFYPRTKSYGMRFLIQIMELNLSEEDESRRRLEEEYNYQNYGSDYSYWAYGIKYKSKFNLDEEEVKLLNQLWYDKTNFCEIEFCFIEVIKLFVSVVSELKTGYEKEGTTLDVQLEHLADVIARKQFRYKKGSWNYLNEIESTPKQIYLYVFKHCENAVRSHYRHKRKLNVNTYYTNEQAKTEYEAKIISKIERIIPTFISEISPLDKPTQIELYSQTTTRWKGRFEELKTSSDFEEEILKLAELNENNPSIADIYFEAAKHISKQNKNLALVFYIHYLNHDLQSMKSKNKRFPKTIYKKLFNTKEQLRDFENIVDMFLYDKELDKALGNVAKIYEVKRKEIQLNKSLIEEAQGQHSDTVELLNEYLQDDNESASLPVQDYIGVEDPDEEDLPQLLVPDSPFILELSLSVVQTKILLVFMQNSLSVSQEEMKKFAKDNGVFRNQLVESINDTCFELLDDILIEEDGEGYVIESNYFDKISGK